MDRSSVRKFFLPDPGSRYLGARWLFLRALGVFHFSAFLSLAYQIRGLIGDDGILPASELLGYARAHLGASRYWLIPSVLWLMPNDHGLVALVVLGLVASVCLVFDLWPRASLVVCGVMFVSFVSAAQDFSMYQSEGMLMDATAAAFVLAPRGLRPGLGASSPPSRAARFLVLWEAFRIYFESGVAKIASGDPTWRNLTAMDRYYENGPLPTWIGWWAQQLPHGFHAFIAGATLVIELVVVFGMFGPRRVRLVTFAILTLLQIGIIATANYCFLNYLVLALGFLLVDDDALARIRLRLPKATESVPSPLRFWAASIWLALLFYASIAVFAFDHQRDSAGAVDGAPAPMSWLGAPAELLEPFRLANRYGLFARMTNVRYEIEFEASEDGVTYVTYPFKFKPQAQGERPGIYAPYQPRFDWNLWFCAIDEEGVPIERIQRVARATCPWVIRLEARLLERSPHVLALFRDDPLHGREPKYVRAVLYRYWMTDPKTLRATGRYWRRERIDTYIDEMFD